MNFQCSGRRTVFCSALMSLRSRSTYAEAIKCREGWTRSIKGCTSLAQMEMEGLGRCGVDRMEREAS